MQLFKNENGELLPIERDAFKLEKDIQSLVEVNMDTIFGLEFVSSEFSITDFRLDSLAYDEQNNSFVIIEYKKGSSYSVVDQGYSYLSTMLNNKADFILEYNEKTGKTLRRDDIDWSASRVIFVSPSFNSYQKNSVNFRDVPFELWEIRKYGKGLIALSQIESSSNESIDKLSGGNPKSVISQVTSEVKVPTEEDHIENLSDQLTQVWIHLKEKLEEYENTSFVAKKDYIAWRKGDATVCFINFRKKDLKIDISRGAIDAKGKKSKNFFNLDDPKNLSEEKMWTWKSGAQGHTYAIRISKLDSITYLLFLLDQKFRSIAD